jgi:predicted ATP-grasp superfamily ATP-dependent carboligase
VSQLLIFGASTRAAAFSALRAGLNPWCADLFADADLRARCPVHVLSADRYPQGFAGLDAPEAPWMYTGGLENAPALVGRMARSRPLWGNDQATLRTVRNPAALHRILRDGGIPCPLIRTRPPDPADGCRWLVKPVAGAGGTGICFWTGQRPRSKKRVYYQEFLEGTPCSAVYVAGLGGTALAGVSTQLIGEPWLHARPFQYCGSLSGLPPLPPKNLEQIGTTLVEAAVLRGLFGVDFVLRDGVAWPLEVNPRYTASVEVLELVEGVSLLAQHCRVFDSRLAASFCERERPRSQMLVAKQDERTILGKAILFAREPVTFPPDGPWQETLRHPPGVWDVPHFADIPQDGDRIEAGWPVLTFFAVAESPAMCWAALQKTARELDHRLYAG